MNSWNEAAEANLSHIYAFSTSFGDINHLRRHLDQMIDDYLGVDQSDSRECRLRWLQLGRSA